MLRLLSRPYLSTSYYVRRKSSSASALLAHCSGRRRKPRSSSMAWILCLGCVVWIQGYPVLVAVNLLPLDHPSEIGRHPRIIRHESSSKSSTAGNTLPFLNFRSLRLTRCALCEFALPFLHPFSFENDPSAIAFNEGDESDLVTIDNFWTTSNDDTLSRTHLLICLISRGLHSSQQLLGRRGFQWQTLSEMSSRTCACSAAIARPIFCRDSWWQKKGGIAGRSTKGRGATV